MSNVGNFAQFFVRQELDGELNHVVVDIDCTKQTIASGAKVTLFDLPTSPGSVAIIKDFKVLVETVEGAAATAQFGVEPISSAEGALTDDSNGLDNAVNLNSLALSISGASDAQFGRKLSLNGGGRVYMTPNAALDAAKISVQCTYATARQTDFYQA